MAKNLINATYSPVLRAAADVQAVNGTAGFLWVPPTYTNYATNSAGVSNRSVQREGIRITSLELHNRSGGTASVGIGGRLHNHYWIAGRLSADDATFTDFTSTAQAREASTLQVTGADQTGFCVLSRHKFDAVSVNISTAETDDDVGAENDHTVEYTTGSTWTTVGANAALTDNFTQTNAVWAAAITNFVWLAPPDWTVSDGLGGVPNGYYGLNFTSAQREASDVAAIATGIELFQLIAVEGVADNGVWEIETADIRLPYVDGLVAYFSTANAGNRVMAEVKGG